MSNRLRLLFLLIAVTSMTSEGRYRLDKPDAEVCEEAAIWAINDINYRWDKTEEKEFYSLLDCDYVNSRRDYKLKISFYVYVRDSDSYKTCENELVVVQDEDAYVEDYNECVPYEEDPFFVVPHRPPPPPHHFPRRFRKHRKPRRC